MQRPLLFALFGLLAATLASSGCGGNAARNPTPTPAKSPSTWWEAPARLVPADDYQLVVLSNIAALLPKLGFPGSPPSCKEVLATSPASELDRFREANKRIARIDSLSGRIYPDIVDEAGFDPCSAKALLTAESGDPKNEFSAYAVTPSEGAIQQALLKNGYAQQVVSGATLFTKGDDGDLTSKSCCLA